MAVTLQIIGHKKSGKTLITTKLISGLSTQGFRVAAIKHDAHHASMDVAGTDSYRFTQAGAHQVLLDSDRDLFYHQTGQAVNVSQLVHRLEKQNDFILIEGHKGLNYPKLVLLKGNESVVDVATNNIANTASLGDNEQAQLIGINQIIKWCLAYLKSRKG